MPAVDFCHVNSDFLGGDREIKKAEQNGFKTNISKIIVLR